MTIFRPSDTAGLISLLFLIVLYLLSTNDISVAIYFIVTFAFILLVCTLYLAFHIFVSYYREMLKSHQQSRLINSFVIVPFYEPPSNIHPAVAGYLIDKNVGTRECLASLFNLIIDGHIAIDERVNSNKYKYYFIKNKGFDEKNSCDRFISEYLFNNKGDIDDDLSLENINIDIWERKQFTKYIISEVISLNYFVDPFEYYYVDKSTLLDPSKYIQALENNLKYSLYFTKKQRDRAKMEIEYYKECLKKDNRIHKNKHLDKFRHRIVKIEDSYANRPMVYTEKGAQERAKWLGFKDYMQTAERFRMNEEKVETFSKYLPYAVALGVETEWTKRFENMEVDRLEWFRSQKDETIRRHDSHAIHYEHLVRFMGRIHTIN